MSINQGSKSILLVVAGLFLIGMSFQNCAAPIDESLLLSSEVDNGGGINGEDTLSSNFQNRAITFSGYINPVTANQQVQVRVDGLDDIADEVSFEYLRGFEVLTRVPTLLTSALRAGDSLTLKLTYKGEQRLVSVPIVVQAASTSINPTTPVNPPITTAPVKLKITNQANTPKLDSYKLDDQEVMQFNVQLDFAADSRLEAYASFVTYEWQKDVFRVHSSGDKTDYTSTGNRSNNMTITANKENVRVSVRVRVVDQRDSSRFSDWAYIHIFADKYKAREGQRAVKGRLNSDLKKLDDIVTQCEEPYAMSGIYVGSGYNNLKAVECSLVWLNDTTYASKSNYVKSKDIYKRNTNYCNTTDQATVTQRLLTAFRSGIVKNRVVTDSNTWNNKSGLLHECSQYTSDLALFNSGSSRGVDEVVLTGGTTEKLISCPSDQYIFGLARAGSYHLSRFYCGRLIPQ